MARLPAGVTPGQIYRHVQFYKNSNGEWETKHLLILAWAPGGDIVFRLLTSRAHGRPEKPPCYHGDPYPGFYLGYLGGNLTAKSWLDLRGAKDYDADAFAADMADKHLAYEMTLPTETLCAALDCSANADDTTHQQASRMRDQRGILACN